MELAKLARPLSGHMLLAITLGLLGHLSAAFIPIMGGMALLDLLTTGFHITSKTVYLMVLILALLRGILRYGEQYCNHFIAFKLLALIREKVFASLRRLCPAKLDGKDKGNLISIITTDIELLEVFYAHTISPIAIASLFALVMSSMLLHFHPLLALIAVFAYFVVGVILPLITSKLNGDSGKRIREQSGELSTFVLDSLRGLSEILQYGIGEKRLAMMAEKMDTLSHHEGNVKRQAGITAGITQVVILFFDLLMLTVAALLCINGEITFAVTLISTITLMSSFGPFIPLSDLGSGLQNTFAAGNRVLDILEETPVAEEIVGRSHCSFSGAKTDNVSFAYNEEEILSDVSVAIPEKSIVGITGKSGSGKSTLLKLLMRFWKTQNGDILISDRTIEDINTQNLRDMQSFVTQETHLFQDSIANNLKIAKQNATQAELETACKKASIHDFIAGLPRGYNTPVGELGDKLSGGERQRIGLARAFLHHAPFLLLDEPTSNLDRYNEAVLLESIAKERKNKTVVLVSHRTSTMKLADYVYSVEQGRVS